MVYSIMRYDISEFTASAELGVIYYFVHPHTARNRSRSSAPLHIAPPHFGLGWDSAEHGAIIYPNRVERGSAGKAEASRQKPVVDLEPGSQEMLQELFPRGWQDLYHDAVPICTTSLITSCTFAFRIVFSRNRVRSIRGL